MPLVLVVVVPIAGTAAAFEDRGTVELNSDHSGVVITARAAGSTSRRSDRKCTPYRPVLVYEFSDVQQDTVRKETDMEALVTRRVDDEEQLLVRRTCRPVADAGTGATRGSDRYLAGGPGSGAGSGPGSGAGSAAGGGEDTGTGTRTTVTLTQEKSWVSTAKVVGSLARSAIDLILFPRTQARFSPPVRARTLVGLDTWYWVPATAWRPIVKVVGFPPVVVTAVARPTALQFLPGDGGFATCPGPGLPWFPGGRSPCSHVYQRASSGRVGGRYSATVVTLWTVHWTSTTGASGVIGPIPIPQRVSANVAEAEAVLRAAPA
ncbi:MAG TPA: hypothetical protein DEP66_03240 [Acidimicrobiaceae bacterium]|nr:hypothetical protein [Acidimicrobiaceae bacterium]